MEMCLLLKGLRLCPHKTDKTTQPKSVRSIPFREGLQSGWSLPFIHSAGPVSSTSFQLRKRMLKMEIVGIVNALAEDTVSDLGDTREKEAHAIP
jgi:hypothetical protein